ncbi:uncharacterized protein LOC108346577 [Vigna angularis]|nr:uncharacterized protein LOC108346577 [Vigna angularis]
MGKIVNSTTKSSPRVADSAVLKNHIEADYDSENFIMIGSVPVPLPRKKVKFSLPWSPITRFKPKKISRRTRADLESAIPNNGHKCSVPSSNFENSNSPITKEVAEDSNLSNPHDESPHSNQCWAKKPDPVNKPHNSGTNSNHAAAVGGPMFDSSVNKPEFRPFDICFRGRRHHCLTKSALHGENKESRIEMYDERSEGWVLGPGMVLLKNFISHDGQVEIVRVCRELGLGPGGFYQPGYANGAKLRLKMMCLGMDWDPQTYKYGTKRVFDGSTPPSIPDQFSELVARSIKKAQSLAKMEYGVLHAEDILPSMTPDICIVNFYTNNGKLGLHQDRDESRESLQKGLPVVSFSIGDSADFLYGVRRNEEEAEWVMLESGDVLIFGGEFRHIFHGVPSILPNSAPKELFRDSGLSPGRLNLTFRQY